MAYNINFNDNDLSNICRALSIKRTILPSRTNNTKEIPSMNGSYYTGYKYNDRVIDAEILLVLDDKTDNNERIKKIGELSRILNTAEPVKIIFSDEPDRYVFGVIDGDTELEKLNNTLTATLSFLCSDPTIYSNKYNSFAPDDRGVISVVNNTNLDTFPYISTTFTKDSSFFQATAFNGDTVLVGYPKDLLAPTLPYPSMYEDSMEHPNVMKPLSDSLLPDTNGSYVGGSQWTLVNGATGKPTALGCTNYGSGDKWHGASGRMADIGTYHQYELSLDFLFSSSSEFDTPEPEPLPPIAPPPTPENPSTECLGTYKVNDRAGLNLRERATTSSKRLVAMEYGDKVYPTEISNGWAKVSYKNKYGTQKTYTGWCSMQYLTKVSSGKTREVDPNAIESQVGTLQMYGFNNDGRKLWDFRISDWSEWFNAASPSLSIEGKNGFYEDATSSATIKKIKKGEGDNVTYENAPSGDVGRWNNLKGKFVISRAKLENGNYKYEAKLYKYNGSTIVETLAIKNSIISADKDELRYLGFFIGTFGNLPPKKYMGLENVKVKNLDSVTPETEVNIPIFRAGDTLQINFNDGEVTCSGIDYMDKLDIGSNFFSIPQGTTKLICKSDDSTMSTLVGTRDCFL